MYEVLLINYASQTLANKKLANLFTFRNKEKIDIEKMVFGWNEILNAKDFYVEILSISESSAQIYAYRPEKLKCALCQSQTKCLLEKLGYNTKDTYQCINHLKKRFRKENFPHEIGIFLGYPYEDVIGFIENKGHKYLTNGYWKVYSNKEEKLKLFDEYNKIKKSYKTIYNHHKNLVNLCVG